MFKTKMEDLEKFCQAAGIDDEIKKDAIHLWQSVQKTVLVQGKHEETHLHWIVCSVYIALCNKRCQEKYPKHRNPTVTELLKAGNLRMVDFFLKMKTILRLELVSNEVKESVERMERKYLVAAALFNKFERLWSSVVTELKGTDEQQRVEKFTQCWLLFIVIKAQQPDVSCDLMMAFDILLCCINQVMNSSSAANSSLTPVKSTFLQHVSSSFGIPFTKIEAVYAKNWLPFIKCVKEGVSLQARYQELYEQQGDFDERLFLKEDKHLGTVSISSSEHNNGQRLQIQVEYSSCLFAAIESSSQTVNIDLPNEALSRFWNNCRKNPTQFVLQLLKASEQVFTTAFLGMIGEDKNHLARKVYTQGRKLYFQVMESMLVAEEKRLNCSDFSALLNSEAFHKALLVCSLEVSLVSSDVTAAELTFPWILSVFGVKPYDFFKVIESFVLHEVQLASNIVRHLNSIEELIVESLAWKTGSSLIEALKKYHPDTYDATPTGKGQSNMKKCQPLNLFLRKVNQLAYMRLTALCSQLELTQEQVLDTWTCLEHSIRFKWELLQDRHLDQMILCAIYSTSKALETDVQFKEIIQVYKKLPHATEQVYKNVPITGDVQDTIIGFYNRVYMPAMKDIILQFTTKKQKPPASPVPCCKSSSLTSPGRPVPGKKNIYVSPLKKSPRNPDSPATKSFFSFGDLPGSADRASLTRINESMQAEKLRAASVTQSAVTKRLRFEDKETSRIPSPSEVVLTHNAQQEPLSRENCGRSSALSETMATEAMSSCGKNVLSGLRDDKNNNLVCSSSGFSDESNNRFDCT